MAIQNICDNLWYKRYADPLLWPFIPLSILFSSIVTLRRLCYQLGFFKTYKANVPVIVIGNITTGGTGKTPLVIHIVNLLKQHGFYPGIVSRGYKSKLKGPLTVDAESDPVLVGDEAVLLAKKLGCPLVMGANRSEALQQLLLKNPNLNIVISDDGMQHYAMSRTMEIAVVDGSRRHGNGFCLPAGPLREPIHRLKHVDFVITNGGIPSGSEYDMEVKPGILYNLKSVDQTKSLSFFRDQTVHAVAGIGNPKRFFNMLKEHHIQVIPHAFPDHHAFKKKDIEFSDDLPVLMTEKDAVKCGAFATEKHWVVSLKVGVNPLFDARFINFLKEMEIK